MLEHFGTFWNILEHFETFWIFLEHFKIFGNIRDIWEYLGLFGLFALDSTP
jgi:hypothetical protein